MSRRAPEIKSFLSIFAVVINGDELPEWIELIPAGKFHAVDGRGPFENSDPNSIVTASIARMPQVGLVLDYDHSTDLAAPEGRPAPAAGWLKQFKVEHGAIFARIEWTADAAEAVKQKKYRYVSPVFEHGKDGKVERILRAALTNNPALISLPALAQAEIAPRRSFAPLRMTEGGAAGSVKTMANEEKKMKLSEVMAVLEKAYPDAHPEKLMKAAACLMADDDDGDDDDDDGDGDGEDEDMDAAGDPYESETAEQMAARQAEEMAKCASDEDKANCAVKHAAEKERFAKRQVMSTQTKESRDRGAQAGSVKEIEKAVARHPMVVRMAGEIDEMRSSQAKARATEKVDAAIREGRLIPSQREWAIAYCASDFAGFDKFLGAQPRILQSGADGTFTARIGEPPKGEASLSQREVDIFANLGLESKEQLDKCAAVKEKWTLRFPRPRLMLDDSNSGVPDAK